jgi:hypothetical protein
VLQAITKHRPCTSSCFTSYGWPGDAPTTTRTPVSSLQVTLSLWHQEILGPWLYIARNAAPSVGRFKCVRSRPSAISILPTSRTAATSHNLFFAAYPARGSTLSGWSSFLQVESPGIGVLATGDVLPTGPWTQRPVVLGAVSYPTPPTNAGEATTAVDHGFGCYGNMTLEICPAVRASLRVYGPNLLILRCSSVIRIAEAHSLCSRAKSPAGALLEGSSFRHSTTFRTVTEYGNTVDHPASTALEQFQTWQ